MPTPISALQLGFLPMAIPPLLALLIAIHLKETLSSIPVLVRFGLYKPLSTLKAIYLLPFLVLP